MDASVETERPNKVILWCTPRSLSTVLTKCLSYVPDSLIWYEPFVGAMRYGTDARYLRREEDIGGSRFDIPDGIGYQATKTDYLWYKRQLEADPPGKKVVFVKANSYAITTRYDAIPDGYRHSFLIRHPRKVLPSWKKAAYRVNKDGPYASFNLSSMPEYSLPSGYFFKEIYDLYQHVKDNYDPKPVVMDGDDLATNPGVILKKYCNSMGIPYTDRLLQWESGFEILQQWQVSRENLYYDFCNFLKPALTSTKFRKPAKSNATVDTIDDISSEDMRCVDLCMPYYEQLRQECLTI